MRPHAVLVNTSRGPLVDSAALAAALEAATIGAAGLDVYEHEPEVPPELPRAPRLRPPPAHRLRHADRARRDGDARRAQRRWPCWRARNPQTASSNFRPMATIEALDTDITRLEVDAIANAANTDLAHGGGVAGAIVRAGGRSIQEESDALAPIELGAAVATGAGDLPCRWVIHAATMRLGGPTSAEIIREATASTLGSPTSSAAARWPWSRSAPASAASRSRRPPRSRSPRCGATSPPGAGSSASSSPSAARTPLAAFKAALEA